MTDSTPARPVRGVQRSSNKSYFHNPAKTECVIIEVVQVNSKGALTGITTTTEFFVHYGDLVEPCESLFAAFSRAAFFTMHWPTK